MFDLSHLGKILITIGVLIIILGGLLLLIGKVPWIGKLPGDFVWRGKNVSFFFPLTTSILISIVLSLILWLINRR